MARIEGGPAADRRRLHSARFAWTQAQKSTPIELGMGWMFKDLERPFIGRDAIRREVEKTSRYRFTGLVVDWQEWDPLRGRRAHPAQGPHAGRGGHDDLRRRGAAGGWASSFMYSPMLQRHIALARVRPDLAAPGTKVNLEVTIDHQYQTVTPTSPSAPLRPRAKDILR
jgi:aminomethyltransferase